jgi:site-specific recombinase XerD
LAVRKRVVKRRDQLAEQMADINNRITTDMALERVMNIYSAEGYRERTMFEYTRFWTEFFRIIPRDYIDEVTTDDFRAFINVLLRKRGLSPVTVNIRMNGMRAMFNRLFNEGLLGEENPVAPVRKLKTDEKPVGAFTDDQVRRLFAQIDKANSYAGFRDYVALLTMLKCGLRINEINSLEVSDIDFDNNVIMLPGAKNKNRKNRSVPMTRKVAEELKQFISETTDFFGEVDTVFVSNEGKRLDSELIRKRMYQYGVKAGMKGECRFSPHNLRHTFATNFLKNGGDINTLREIMGHSDIKTTQVYLNYTDEDIRDKYNKVALKDTLDV